MLQEHKHQFRVLLDHIEAQLEELLQLHAQPVLQENTVPRLEVLVKQVTVQQAIIVLQEVLSQNKIFVKLVTIVLQAMLQHQ